MRRILLFTLCLMIDLSQECHHVKTYGFASESESGKISRILSDHGISVSNIECTKRKLGIREEILSRSLRVKRSNLKTDEKKLMYECLSGGTSEICIAVWKCVKENKKFEILENLFQRKSGNK